MSPAESTLFEGISVPYSLRFCTRVRLFQEAELWTLTSRNGTFIATFHDQNRALEWWERFCASRSVMHHVPLPTRALPKQKRKERLKGPAAKRRGELHIYDGNSAPIRIRRCSCGHPVMLGQDTCYSCR